MSSETLSCRECGGRGEILLFGEEDTHMPCQKCQGKGFQTLDEYCALPPKLNAKAGMKAALKAVAYQVVAIDYKKKVITLKVIKKKRKPRRKRNT